MTVLRTGRLALRAPRPADIDAVHAMVSEWEVVRWTASWPWPPDRALTEARLRADPPGDGPRAAILRDGDVVGLAGIADGVLGYMLAPAAWGRGYATEACAALVGHAFETTDRPDIAAAVFAGNAGSLRVLGKLGFVEVGQGKSRSRAHGRDLPGTGLRLLRRAWLDRATQPGQQAQAEARDAPDPGR